MSSPVHGGGGPEGTGGGINGATACGGGDERVAETPPPRPSGGPPPQAGEDSEGRTAMTRPVNLRQARKRKIREDKAKAAQANRSAHGTPKAARDLEAARRERLARQVDEHKRDSGPQTRAECPDAPGTRDDRGPGAG